MLPSAVIRTSLHLFQQTNQALQSAVQTKFFVASSISSLKTNSTASLILLILPAPFILRKNLRVSLRGTGAEKSEYTSNE